MTEAASRRRPWLVGGAALAVVVAAVLAFGVFEVQTAFIDRAVSEAAPTARAGDAPRPVARGAFQPVEHDAAGSAVLLDTGNGVVLRLDDEFATSNGPDLFVVAVVAGRTVELGALKGNEGAQNYPLPGGTDPSQVERVSIWCKRFDATFATAELG